MAPAPVAAILLLVCGPAFAADGPEAKPAIRGLVSMGAFKFVGSGGDPVNTLEPLDAKPGIFGGLVVVATGRSCSRRPDARSPTATRSTGRWPTCAPTTRESAASRSPSGCASGAASRRRRGRCSSAGRRSPAVHNNKQRHVGRFWSPAYRQAWRRLQEQLAAKYDSWPLIREVAMTSCMSFTAEPFFLPTEDSGAEADPRGRLQRRGLQGMPARAASTTTRHGRGRASCSRSIRCAPALGQGPGDPAFTERVMRDCRKALGVRCVFDNHDLDADLPKPLVPIYALMKQLGPEIVFQTGRTNPARFRGHDQDGRRATARRRSSCGRTTRDSRWCRTEAQALGHDGGSEPVALGSASAGSILSAHAADDHHHPPAGDRPRLPAAQEPGASSRRSTCRFGKAHVFYPEATAERCTAALLLDVDPVGLVRGRKGPAGEGFAARPVRQRPALRRLVVPERGDRAGLRLGARRAGARTARNWPTSPIPLEARLAVLPCRGGEAFLRRCSSRSATRSTATRHPLDEPVPEWGESRVLHRRRSGGRAGCSELLTHLYVLIPVLDDDKHYWVGDDEVEKLLRHGEGWLAAHPRARSDRPALPASTGAASCAQALARLVDEDEPDPDAEAEVARPRRRRSRSASA